MKRYLLLAMMTAFVGLAFGQKAHIQGKATGLEPRTRMVVGEVVGNKLTPRDTLTIDPSGRYNATITPTQPTLYIISFLMEQSPTLHVMVMPNEKITLDMEYAPYTNGMRITSAKGTSGNAALYKEFNNINLAAMEAQKRIDDEYILPATTDSRKAELALLFQEQMVMQKQQIRNLLASHTGDLMSAFLVTFFESEFITYIDLYEAIRDGLVGKYADNDFVRHLVSKIASSLGPGFMAPEIAMKDPEGNERKLSDLRGKVVLIDFWASWCGPCRMENPNVVKLYNKYHAKGFEIYSVSMDKRREDWVQAIMRDNLVWPNHVSDLKGWTSSGGAAYGVSSIPHTVLIDRQGRIIAKNLRGEALSNKLKEIFGE